MFNVLTGFASEATGIPLAAEPIFHFLGLSITNSMFFGVVMAAIVVGLFMWAARRSNVKPGGKFSFAVETLVEAIIKLGEDNFGSREKAIKHLPLLLTLFAFILFSNLAGLVPGIGTVNITTDDGVSPLLRPFTTDLNATLAMAILTIGTIQFYAITELGILGHLKHYFTDKPYKPLNLFIGLLDVMGEFIRIITLSMRLFGVIYAGEVLIHVVGELAGNFGWAATFPVYLMEIFFGVIQAYLFMMLAMVYMAIATRNDHAEHPPTPDHSSADKLTAASGTK